MQRLETFVQHAKSAVNMAALSGCAYEFWNHNYIAAVLLILLSIRVEISATSEPFAVELREPLRCKMIDEPTAE